jgi:uncharacterized protein (DUF58 family)
VLPSLARRGVLVLATAATFMVVGALYGQASIVALGGVALSAMMSAYLWFFPAAILLRRRKIELSWWVPPGDQAGGSLTVERPFALHLALRNHGARRLRVLSIVFFASRALEPARDLEAVVPAGQQVELIGEVRARAAGYHVVHGAVLSLGDVLGLFEIRAYFPNPIAVKVFPRETVQRAEVGLRPLGAPIDERSGRNVVRRRGVAGEVREIREHGHGDPFKLIAWKATARRGKLMVRDLETEIVATHQLLLDIGGTMRGGAVGRTRLDRATELCAGLARAAIDGGDRVGLVTFDTRPYSELKPDEGRAHLFTLLDRLLEVHAVVDEDLTDVTGGELVAAAAAYLAHQEAIDVRVRRPPPLDDEAWSHIQAGPNGELYDLVALDGAIGTLLKGMDRADQKSPAWWWSRVQIAPGTDELFARLRLFCRLRGLELPYRRGVERRHRVDGLTSAVRRATTGRIATLTIVSDLGGLAAGVGEAMAAIARARRAGAQVAVVAPLEAPLIASPRDASAGRVLAALVQQETLKMAATRRLLAGHGIPLIELGPSDGPGTVLARLSRRGPTRRVA